MRTVVPSPPSVMPARVMSASLLKLSPTTKLPLKICTPSFGKSIKVTSVSVTIGLVSEEKLEP